MKMYVGGAYQGKRACAERAQGKINWEDGESCAFEKIDHCQGILHFHSYIRRMLEAISQQQTDIQQRDIEQRNIEQSEIQQEEADFPYSTVEELERELPLRILRNNPELIIEVTEVGCGIVPMEEKERIYRELVGRICTGLAAQSEEVYRVVCGIETRIK